MCETDVYIVKDNEKQLVMDSVVILRPEDGKIYLRSLLGKEEYVEATIQEINFLDHHLLLKAK